MRGNPFAPTGSPSPLMDGLRPIFVEHGADPTAAPGFDAPMGSMLRFGADYYEKRGPGLTDWVLYPPAAGQDWYRTLRPQDAGATFVAGTTRIQYAGYERTAPGTTTAGIGTAVNLAAAGAVNDRYFAIPDYFPRSGSIRRLCFFGVQAGFAAAGRIQLHVYSSGFCNTAPFVGFPYPDQLLLSGTLYTPLSQGVSMPLAGQHVYDSLTDFHISGDSLLWFVMRVNASTQGAGSKAALAKGCMVPWMGFVPGVADANTTGACGWYHSHTFTDGAAQTFPQSTPVVIACGSTTSTVEIPAIGYGFQADL